MTNRDRDHLFISRTATAEEYRSSGRSNTIRRTITDRQGHAHSLIQQITAAEATGKQRRQEASKQLDITPEANGIYITFESWPGFDLQYSTLNPKRRPPELISTTTTKDENGIETHQANVYIPGGSLGYFLRKIEEYANQETSTGKPKNASFVEQIRQIKLSSLRELWTDNDKDYPEHGPSWWEVWLRKSDGNELDRLSNYAARSGCRLKNQQLGFDDRIIVLVWASAEQLSNALEVLDDIGELRSSRTYASFFVGLEPSEEASWVKDLADRIQPADLNSPVTCVFDTGIDRHHVLLAASLSASDTHSYDPTWSTTDHHGHGTEMAGLALYGDLKSALESSDSVPLHHRLESVKILPPHDDNDPDLYGAIMAESVGRVEVTAPNQRRVISMAVTAPITTDPGRPTLWSSAIDALAAGRSFDSTANSLSYLDESSIEDHRLFLISAGNVQSLSPTDDYLSRCDSEPVEDPGQSWNAVTVGAMTNMASIDHDELGFDDYTPVATAGDLCPFSRTSRPYTRIWPVKPDILLEGGNAGSSTHTVDTPTSHQLLTTRRGSYPGRQLTTTNATSAATAQAAHMAASIWAKYPLFWPETVRGLLVHSAEWTPTMLSYFDPATRTERGPLLRRYGYGVPTLERCLYSATNALTLITEETIHPFQDGKLLEMHLHDLPWPKEVLEGLGETPVRMRITLSYFIEPSPTRIGPERSSRYASCGLRFDVNRPTESPDQFRQRINALAREEEGGYRSSQSQTSNQWYLGSRARNTGSLHSDIWSDTAAAIASMSNISVYPVGGWWKELPTRDRSAQGVRYSLLVSLETPAEEVDLWTPIAQQIATTIEV